MSTMQVPSTARFEDDRLHASASYALARDEGDTGLSVGVRGVGAVSFDGSTSQAVGELVFGLFGAKKTQTCTRRSIRRALSTAVGGLTAEEQKRLN